MRSIICTPIAQCILVPWHQGLTTLILWKYVNDRKIGKNTIYSKRSQSLIYVIQFKYTSYESNFDKSNLDISNLDKSNLEMKSIRSIEVFE